MSCLLFMMLAALATASGAYADAPSPINSSETVTQSAMPTPVERAKNCTLSGLVSAARTAGDIKTMLEFGEAHQERSDGGGLSCR